MSTTATTKYIWFDGKLVDWDKAQVHVMTHALHYGTSVFEGIRAYDTPKGTCIFRLHEHIKRLFNSAWIYQMEIPYTREQIEDACCEIITSNDLKGGYIRPLVFIGNVGLGVNPPIDPKTGKAAPCQVAIGAVPWGAYLGEDGLKNGIDICVSSWSRLAPNTIPTGAKAAGNYLSSLLICKEARRNGYTEAVSLNPQGYIAEGSGENVFLIRDGVVYTSTITSSILPGITRDSIIRVARDLGYEVREEFIPREALYLADEVFMCGTAAEITPVRSIDRYQVGEGHRGPITEKIQKEFFRIVHGEDGDKRNWLVPVKK